MRTKSRSCWLELGGPGDYLSPDESEAGAGFSGSSSLGGRPLPMGLPARPLPGRTAC